MKPGLYDRTKCRIVGDQGLLVEFGEGIDKDVNTKVRMMAINLEKSRPNGILEIIPSYRSILITYDPCVTNPYMLEYFIEDLEQNFLNSKLPDCQVVEIPVCYGGEYGPDLEFVAGHNALTTQDVIRIHSSSEYLIYMIGFTPGFPFLGGMSDKLSTPRLETPRVKVPKGSVGIANNQTGIYPLESPGGWQLIGQTPLNLFDPDRKDPLLYQAGDSIKFTPITETEFRTIKNKEAN